MKTYGLIGEHLSHSFSKEIHESIADYRYDLIPLDKEAFCSFMEDRDFAAVNVTIPYKKAVIPYLDELDEAAQAIGRSTRWSTAMESCMATTQITPVSNIWSENTVCA